MIHLLFGYVISINKQTAVGKKQKMKFTNTQKRIIIKRGAINNKQTH